MIVARVQGHPGRADLHSALADSLTPLQVEVLLHESDPPSPWMGYMACLSSVASGEHSHGLVIQDDAQPCPNFSQALEQIAERHPTTPVCLFIGSMPASTAVRARRAMIKGERYVPLSAASFVPLVAVLWPRHKAQEFLNWTKTARGITRADDGNAARWARGTKQQIMVTVPSLVQHNDFIPSVKGGRDHKPGAESWRQALFVAEDALSYDWCA